MSSTKRNRDSDDPSTDEDTGGAKIKSDAPKRDRGMLEKTRHHIERKEYARLKQMEQKTKEEIAAQEYAEKIEAIRQAENEKTAKKRQKRRKRRKGDDKDKDGKAGEKAGDAEERDEGRIQSVGEENGGSAVET
ncbi:hypothetical protein HK101_006529 [Irineochytrium annulatum]|nr:hypothetical protein HK101_006529 [Irineochytrium annulatum]